MKLVFRIIAAVLFIIFFGFALKNTQEVALRFFLDYEIRGPLVLLLLGFFTAGAVMGVLAMTPTLFRHRRDLSKQKKTIMAMQKENEAQQMARNQPPQPDSIVNP
ncbi:MAG TPA: LapA family protein [Burkholderiaceae bacterium]|nr:LapA family protein [Burkholderiaceae bacterium]